MQDYTVHTDESGPKKFKVTGPAGTGVLFESTDAIEAVSVSLHLYEAYQRGLQEGQSKQRTTREAADLTDRIERLLDALEKQYPPSCTR